MRRWTKLNGLHDCSFALQKIAILQYSAMEDGGRLSSC